jgi:hypothetical protein
MKHWDLFPGETATLRCGARTLTGRFLFRDTKIAAFKLESGEYREFKLRQGGSLREPMSIAEILGAAPDGCYRVSASEVRGAVHNSRVWAIEGEDRHTRGMVAGASDPLESRRAFSTRMVEAG